MTFVVVIPFVRSTVWRKQRSGLQYWGSSWSQKDSQRVRCPHSQFDRGDYSLQINSVTEKDGGLYTCRIEYGNHVYDNQVTLRIIKGKKLMFLMASLVMDNS